MNPTIKQLRELTKRERKDILYRLSDYLAYYPAKLFLLLNLSPNKITILWILIQFICNLFILTGDRMTVIISLIIFQSMFIIDCSDGIVARYTKNFTLNGIYLDRIGHNINNPLLLIALGFNTSVSYNNSLLFILGVFSAICYLLNKSLELNPLWYKDKTQQNKIVIAQKRSFLQNQKIIYFLFALVRIEYMFNLLFWLVLFGFMEIAIITYSSLIFVELIRKVIAQYKSNSEIA